MSYLNKDHSIFRPKVLFTNIETDLSNYLAKEFATNGFEIFAINTINLLPEIQIDVTSVNQDELRNNQEGFDVLILNETKETLGPFCETYLFKEKAFLSNSIVLNLSILKSELKKMKKRDKGKIFFFSSPGPIVDPCFESLAGAYRSFVLSFISGLRKELKEANIQLTDMIPLLNHNLDFSKFDYLTDPELFAKEIFYSIMGDKKHVIEPHLTDRIEHFFKYTLLDLPTKLFLS